MGALMQQMDWAATRLGPVETWSPALRMMVRFLLANRFPLLLWWGPDFCQLYNDAYRPILGTKHPARSLGQPARECWREIWHILDPLICTPFEGGPATWMEDIPLEIDRYGFMEETHFTIAYSPVPDETAPRGIGGVLATVHEISEKVVGERRTMALRDLGAGVADERNAEEACVRAAEILAKYPKDVPFSLLYLLAPDQRTARLAGTSGMKGCASISPDLIIIDPEKPALWPLLKVLETGQSELVDLNDAFGSVPKGPWYDPSNQAAIVPIHSNTAHQLAGFLVAGLSPRLRFDDSYSGFLDLASSQIATAIANARAYEEERKRAEALAEIDRAKTLFFSNVSHEFRTPLTLMLGPLEDALSEGVSLPSAQQERLEVAHRNSMRLLKLVNTLLDFSRIEAGRIEACYEPTDLSQLTTELASVFRSAVERAGLKLIVRSEQFGEPIYIDREMWEKIVFNLLSNALKFTFAGEIEVSLTRVNGSVELSVRDSGTGIPAHELPHLFERFYRVKGAHGRTFEGSGIGLALVQELAKLHGGRVRVESEEARGSTFTVSIPVGKDHFPPDRIGAPRSLTSTGTRGEAYVQEALRWLPGSGDNPNDVSPSSSFAELDGIAHAEATAGARILLADDNADMREYVQRLLQRKYKVIAVGDGQTALESAREHHPDLILTDVMMPRLDGFGLLRELRADKDLRSIPVILLSARAGEESRLEGLGAGADDYLMKPFSARELFVRVSSQLHMARIRQAAAESEHKLRAEAELDRDRLRQEIADIKLLHSVSEQLIYGKNVASLYQKILDVAVAIMRSEYASMQALYPDRGNSGELLLLAHHGFSPEAAKFWEWVDAYSASTCGVALRTRERTIADDVETCPYMVGTPDQTTYLQTGIRAVQSTPLISRNGRLVGVISTHWHRPHQPSERDLRLLDILARQAADLLERTQAEDVLREGEERFRALVNASSYVVYRMSPDWSEMRQLEGRGFISDTQEPRNNWIHEYIDPDDQPLVLKTINHAIETKTVFELEHRVRRVDGTLGWTLSRAVPLLDKDGNIMEWFGAASDVTARKNAEEARRRLAAIVESSHDAIISKDLNGIITSWNRQAERLFGYKEEEIVGRSILTIIPPELRSDEEMILNKINSGEKIDHFETVRLVKSGERIEVSLSISPVRDERGNVIGAAKIVRDIRESKKIERALRTTEKLAAAGRLAATVAHEINNPLEAVSNLVFLAKRDASDADKVSEYLRLAERELDRVAHISRQTLGFYRDTSSPTHFGVVKIIDDLLYLYEKRLETRKIQVIKQYKNTPEITAFAGEIRQSLSNLISNAIDAMPSGGSLVVRVSEVREWGNSLQAGVRITVLDTGTGIPVHARNSLFEPFFTTKADVGTGLGLWITKNMVEKHHGNIRFISRTGLPNHGTAFSIFLPFSIESQQPRRADKAKPIVLSHEGR